jgi:molecular chaperone GrpE
MSINTEQNKSNLLEITEELRNKLIEELGGLLKEKKLLNQEIRQQEANQDAEKTAFLLELLEVIDSLDNLLDSFSKQTEITPEFCQRLPRVIGFIQRKLLNTLDKQEVTVISLEKNQVVDINVCRVVETEIREDLPEGSLVHLLKKGYMSGSKVLRPAETIVSKTLNDLEI